MSCDRKNNKEVCEIREDYMVNDMCGCGNRNNMNFSNMTSGFPSNYMYGHAYVPNQVYSGNSFTPNQGLQNGTMFPELVSPYEPLDSMRVIETLRNRGGECN